MNINFKNRLFLSINVLIHNVQSIRIIKLEIFTHYFDIFYNITVDIIALTINVSK